MNLANVKMVVSDMDGTLLNSNHEISSRFFKVFKKLQEHKIKFVAASGRPLYSITDKFAAIKDDITIVAENGGLAFEDNNIILSHPIKPKRLAEIRNLVFSIKDVHPVFCSRNKAYVISKSKPLLRLLTEYYANYQHIERADVINESIYKVALYHEKSSEQFVYPYVKTLESNFKIKLSATHWLDISENIANKGHAIALIQQKYNITPSETLVFGDYHNDLEMLDRAYFSYAMENAHPDVIKKSRFKTASNNNFGVELILEELLKQKIK